MSYYKWHDAEAFRIDLIREVEADRPVNWLVVWKLIESRLADIANSGPDYMKLWLDLTKGEHGPDWQRVTYAEAVKVVGENRKVWERLVKLAYAESAAERAAEDAEHRRALAEQEAEEARRASAKAVEAAAARELAEAAAAVEREREGLFLATLAEASAAELARLAGNAMDREWVKRRSAVKVPREYAEMAAKPFERGYAHQMYPVLVGRVQRLSAAAAEFKGCPDLVASMRVPWQQAGGSGRVFWHAVCEALDCVPYDQDEGAGEVSDYVKHERAQAGLTADVREGRAIETWISAKNNGIYFASWSELAAAVNDPDMNAESIRRKVLYPMHSEEGTAARKENGQPYFDIENGQVMLRNNPEEIISKMDGEGES